MNEPIDFPSIPKQRAAGALKWNDDLKPQWRAAQGTETVVKVWFMNEWPDYVIQIRY